MAEADVQGLHTPPIAPTAEELDGRAHGKSSHRRRAERRRRRHDRGRTRKRHCPPAVSPPPPPRSSAVVDVSFDCDALLITGL